MSTVLNLLNEIDPSKIRALYDRPGTPGEKEAAGVALRRLGLHPDQQRKPTLGPKKYSVMLKYTFNNKELHIGPHETEASDEIDAEHKAREHAKDTWRMTVGGRAPEFRLHTTTRI
jgi:hypothetical protein